MASYKTMVCVCENCGNEAEMNIKCEEVVREEAAKSPTPPPKARRTVVCTQCGNEAEMIVDYKERK